MISINPGDYMHLKRGIPHKFKNIGDTPGKLIVILSPPGLEKLFEKGTLVEDVSSFDFKSTRNNSKSLGPSDRSKTLGEYGITEVNG